MDNIVADNGYAIGSIEHLMMLLHLAIARTEGLGIPFKRENYRWVLGVKIIHEIETKTYYVMAEFPDRQRTLFGVPVDMDMCNPDNIQLWENITNKL